MLTARIALATAANTTRVPVSRQHATAVPAVAFASRSGRRSARSAHLPTTSSSSAPALRLQSRAGGHRMVVLPSTEELELKEENVKGERLAGNATHSHHERERA